MKAPWGPPCWCGRAKRLKRRERTLEKILDNSEFTMYLAFPTLLAAPNYFRFGLCFLVVFKEREGREGKKPVSVWQIPAPPGPQ